MKKSLGLLVLACLLGNVGWSATQQDRWVASQMARVVIDREGHVTSAKLQDSHLGTEMQAKIERRIRQFEFEPARKNDVPVETETSVWVHLTLEPDGEKFALNVSDAGISVGMLKLTPPRFPRSQLTRSQGAEVELRVAYDAEGVVTDVEVIRAEPDLKVFREATIKAARQWLFAPERIDGEAMAGSAQIPVRFEFEGEGVGQIRFPDGGTLQVSRERKSQRQLLGSNTRLRSIGEEVADSSPTDATAAKPAG